MRLFVNILLRSISATPLILIIEFVRYVDDLNVSSSQSEVVMRLTRNSLT